MPHSHSWGASSSGELYSSHIDSLRSPKEASSLAASPYSHSQAFTCPTADPERVVLLRGFYWRSSAADVRQICEQDFGPVRVVLLYQGKLYPEAFVDFVHRRDAAQCVIRWTKRTKIYRTKDRFGNGSSFINWTVGVSAYSYKPLLNDVDWARAWEERSRMERGELPEEVLAPRWKQAFVREEEGRRMRKQYPQAKYPSASRSKEQQPQDFRDSRPAAIQNCPSPPMIDAGVVNHPSMEIGSVLTGVTLVGSPASCSRGGMDIVNIDDFLEEIVKYSDLATLSFAKAALQRAVQNFMDTVNEFDALTYEHYASEKAENFDVPHSGIFRARGTSMEGAAGEQNSFGLVQALFHIQRMIEPDLRV